MKKHIITSYILLFSIVVSLLPTTVLASEDGHRKTEQINVEKMEIEDDTVVCYYKGVPITKAQVGEHNVINKDVIEQIERELLFAETGNGAISSYAMVDSDLSGGGAAPTNKVTRYVTIPSKYNEAIVEVSLSSVNFTQKTTSMYLTKENATSFADSIVYSDLQTIVAMFLGFIPYIGVPITVTCTRDSLYKNNVATEIRSYTDDGYKVRIDKIVTSGYGTYYVVDKWTNRTVQYTTFSDRYTTQKPVGISCK